MGLPLEQIITPMGELVWIRCTGEGKKDLNGKNKFVAGIRYKTGSPEAEALANKIKTFWEENKPKAAQCKSMGFKEERGKTKDDGSKGDPTGYVLFDFKTDTVWKDGKAKVVDIYNSGDRSKGIKPTKIHLGDKSIGNGSIGKISGAMGIYDRDVATRGVSLYLGSIQLLKFIEYSTDAGFDAEEGDGYQGEAHTDESSGFSAPTEGENSTPKPQL